MSTQSTVSVDTGGGILLVEEYDALAVAFGAALRQLVPTVDIRVVRSLAAAEAAAAERPPALFILDFDPGHLGSVGFFNRMKASLPDVPVLIIAAGVSREFARLRGSAGAFQFIEKPFELSVFGAAIRTLLNAADASGSGHRVGRLRDLDLADLIALFGLSNATLALTVSGTGGRNGEIHFSEGQVRQAVVMGKSGVAALEEMLRWRSPRFGEGDVRDNSPRAIHGTWSSVLIAALRTVQPEREAAQAEEVAAPVAALSLPPAKKVVVIDDTELLLVFVEEILAQSDRNLQIATALTGRAGLNCVSATLPDLVLLDYSLPDIFGDTICERLLADERTAGIPVIMMSGHVAELAATAERCENVVATIAKPFLSGELLNVVERILDKLPELAAKPRSHAKPKIEKAQRSERKVRTNGKQSAHSPPAISPPAPPPPAPEKVAPPEILPPEEPPDASVADAEGGNGKRAQTPSEETAPEKQADAPPVVTPLEIESPGVLGNAPALEYLSSTEPAAEDEAAGSSSLTIIPPAAEAQIPIARNNAVVLSLPLEVTSLQLTPELHVKAIRARPYRSTVSLQVLPEGGPQISLAERTFELTRVDLDHRGQIDFLRLTPTGESEDERENCGSLSVADVSLVPTQGDPAAMRLTPAAGVPMRLQLLALFELAAVELSEEIGVRHLILKTRGAKVRVNLQPGAANPGVTFESAQVLLDHSARIAEVLLDSLV